MALVVLSGKVTPEVQEQFKAAQEASEAMTHNAFLELLLEAFLNPKIKNNDVPRPTAEQLQELQLKDNEIGRLQIQIDFANTEVSEKVEKIETLQRHISEWNQQEPAQFEPIEGQELISIPTIIAYVLDKEAQTAMRKSGKKLGRADILLNCFWETIKIGRYTPFLLWSNRELSEAVKSLKTAE